MKIAIAVHGRFHAFDLAAALAARKHQVTLLTNYPEWAVRHFKTEGVRVRSFWAHGGLHRANFWLNQRMGFPYAEAPLHRLFGWWVFEELRKERWDLIHCWSGVALESLEGLKPDSSFKLLMRGSAHIRTQAAILAEEEKRTGMKVEKPSQWMMAREESEYRRCDRIRVLSSFAYRSFVERGVPEEKLLLIPSGMPVESFRSGEEVIEARRRRVLSGDPLRVLYVGAVSFQKGFWDAAAVLRRLGGDPRFKFRFVGPVATEANRLVAKVRHLAEFSKKVFQQELPAVYAWADLFLFPSLQEGYSQALAQACASALPVIATENCSARDFIENDKTGWEVPARSAEALIERLEWAQTHRSSVAGMIDRLYREFRPRRWDDVAREFEEKLNPLIRGGPVEE
ncbi:MAG: glycosyltransferase family 4 protein [Candidatus Omnitrophica bacterium]|nr:glycosyltransferase family 4 protein [Candidatus Omnitrophota bacterium]